MLEELYHDRAELPPLDRSGDRFRCLTPPHVDRPRPDQHANYVGPDERPSRPRPDQHPSFLDWLDKVRANRREDSLVFPVGELRPYLPPIIRMAPEQDALRNRGAYGGWVRAAFQSLPLEDTEPRKVLGHEPEDPLAKDVCAALLAAAGDSGGQLHMPAMLYGLTAEELCPILGPLLYFLDDQAHAERSKTNACNFLCGPKVIIPQAFVRVTDSVLVHPDALYPMPPTSASRLVCVRLDYVRNVLPMSRFNCRLLSAICESAIEQGRVSEDEAWAYRREFLLALDMLNHLKLRAINLEEERELFVISTLARYHRDREESHVRMNKSLGRFLAAVFPEDCTLRLQERRESALRKFLL